MIDKIPELRRLISKGKTKLALEKLLTQLANMNDDSLKGMRDEFLLMSSRFESLESRLLTGVIPYADYELTENRLISSSIKMLNKLEANLNNNRISKPDKKETKERKASQKEDQSSFHIQGPRGAYAKGKPSSYGFIVYQGSTISVKTVASLSATYHKLRDSLLEDGTIINENDTLVFTKDYFFSSPSSAASIVLGRSANGLSEWKLSTGVSLKAIRRQ